MSVPPLKEIRQNDTHRLIPCKYTKHAESVLALIAKGEDLKNLFDLEQATNDRRWAESDLLPGINSQELVFEIRNCHVVNAAFTHANPNGSRFNGPQRGAWYAGFQIETSQAEVIFHKTVEYAEIGRFEDTVEYDDYLADFGGEFHDLRKAASFDHLLDPQSYVASQAAGEELLQAGSLGIIYPSVRHVGGTCLVCFRPAAVANVRKHYRYSMTWAGHSQPKVACLSLPF